MRTQLRRDVHSTTIRKALAVGSFIDVTFHSSSTQSYADRRRAVTSTAYSQVVVIHRLYSSPSLRNGDWLVLHGLPDHVIGRAATASLGCASCSNNVERVAESNRSDQATSSTYSVSKEQLFEHFVTSTNYLPYLTLPIVAPLSAPAICACHNNSCKRQLKVQS